MSQRTLLFRALVLGAIVVLSAFAWRRFSPSDASPLSLLPATSPSLPGALRATAPSSPSPLAVRPGAVRQLSPTFLLDENSRLWSYLKSYGNIDSCISYETQEVWSRSYRMVTDAVAIAPLNYPDGLCSLDAQGSVACCQRPLRPPPSTPGRNDHCWRGIPYSSDSRANAALQVPKPGQPAPLDPLCQDGSFVPRLHDVQEITGAATSHCLIDNVFGGSSFQCGVTPTCALRRDGTIVCWTSLEQTPYSVPTPPAWGKVTHLQISDVGQLVISTEDGRVASSIQILRELEDDRLPGHPSPVKRAEPIRFQTLFKLPEVTQLTAGAEVCAAQAHGEVWCARYVSSFRQKCSHDIPIGVIPARRMRNLNGVRSLSSNDGHSCAVDEAGQLRCWGLRIALPPVVKEDDREESLLTRGYFAQPVRVETRRPAKQVAVLPHATCAVLDDDSLQCLEAEVHSFMGVF